MTSYSKILNEISAGLSGDAEKDVAYLRNLTRTSSAAGPDGIAFRRAIARLTFKLAPDSAARIWRRAFREATEKFDARLRDARSLFDDGRFGESLDVLTALAAKVDGLFDPDARTQYRRFRNPLEEAICDRFLPSAKERRRAPIDYPALYSTLGETFFELRRTVDAKNAFKKGLAFNPVDVELLFRTSDANRRERDFREYLRTTTEALRYSYRRKDLARGYRNLGAFCVEVERYESATCLYYFSLTFDDDATARRELRFVESRTRRPAKAPPFEKIRRVFEKEEFQLGPDARTVDAVRELAEKARADADRSLARDCFDVVFRLTNDPDAKRALDELTARDEESRETNG